MKSQHIADAIFGWIDRIGLYAGYFSGGLSLILTLLITYGVALRYLFNSPIFWIDEISGYTFVAYISIGIVYATLTESHISSEMLISRMSNRVQFSVAIIGYVMALLVSCAMVYYGGKTTVLYYTLGWKSETTLGVSLWPVWITIPIGFTLFALCAISRIRVVTARFLTTGSIEPPSPSDNV